MEAHLAQKRGMFEAALVRAPLLSTFNAAFATTCTTAVGFDIVCACRPVHSSASTVLHT